MIQLSALKATTLKSALSSTALVMKVRELADRHGELPSWADLDTDFIVAVVKQGDQWEQIKITNLVQEDDGSCTLTIHATGRGILPIPPYTGFATGFEFGVVADVIFTNDMLTMSTFANTKNDNDFEGDNTFVNNPQKTTSALASNNNDFITKNDLLNAVLGSVITDQVVISGTAGENLTIGNVAYFKESDQKWWKADADLVGTFDQVVVAIVQATALANASVNVLLQGVDKTQTGLTLGSKYYLSNTAGAMSTTAGTTEVFLGWAQTATRFIFDPLGLYQPTSGEKAAMAGVGDPSSTNLFETQNDTSNGATITGTTISFTASSKTIADSGNGFVTAGFKQGQAITVAGTVSNNGIYTILTVSAGSIIVSETLVNESAGSSFTITASTVDKLVRAQGDGNVVVALVPTLDNHATSKSYSDAKFSSKKNSYTADGDIAQNDTVYVSANDELKSLSASAMGTGSAISTSANNYTANRSLPLSTNGQYLHITGGEMANSNGINAVVRTINAGETDLASGSVQAIYTTGNGSRGYDVKKIGTDKFLFIFQADTGGAAAGVKVVVVTVSGTTITVGSVLTIETTGNLEKLPSLAKLDTDKAIIFYNKDSDGFLYAQVLTVSGTTITTNTPVQVKGTGGNSAQSVQLATNSVAVVYGNTNSNLFGATVSVSVTTPTVNAEQTLVSGTSTTWKFGLEVISATKLLFAYSENGSSTNDQLAIIAISGATMTKSSNIALAATRSTYYFGMAIIGSKLALVLDYLSATSSTLKLINISGSAPVEISTQNLANSNNSSLYLGYNIVKISPWTYITNNGGSQADGDFIVKLTPASSARIGIAESAILDNASGTILNRYATHTLTGLSLTAGSLYYTDDTGQPTVNSSLTAPTLGIAISSTKMLIQ